MNALRPPASISPDTAQPRPVPTGLTGGLGLFWEASRWLRRNPGSWALALVPVLFASAALGATAALIVAKIDLLWHSVSGFMPTLESGAWYTWLWVGPGRLLLNLVSALILALGIGLALIVAMLVAKLASAPFLDLLSQRVEQRITGRAAGASGARGTWVEIRRSLVAEGQRTLFFAGVWLLLSGIGFVLPGAHVVTGPLLLAFSILFLPLDFAGFALDRRQVPFARRRRWVTDHLAVMSGFGLACFAGLFVPFVNLLAMPALVVGGTLLVLGLPTRGEGASGASVGSENDGRAARSPVEPRGVSAGKPESGRGDVSRDPGS